jgi:hypothetical protein
MLDPDPYVFGAPGYGSVIICADPSIIKQNSKKTWISTALELLNDFLSLKNGVNVSSNTNKQKNLEIFLLLAS